jgi:tetratricopeptide (TPR) repeat protein
MNTMYRSLLFALIVLFVVMNKGYSQDVSLNSQLKKGKSLTYEAMILHDKDLLLKAHSTYEEILQSDKSNPEGLYGLTFTEYKLLEMSLQKENESLFEKYYQSALGNAAKLMEIDKYPSEGKSLLAGIYMMEIANSPMTAVTLSSEINGLLNDAEKLNPQNLMTFIVRGEMKYNTPKVFGGSYEDAVKNFSKAVAICEQNPDSEIVDTSWGHLESLAWLGRAYLKLENYDSAKFTYQKALNIEPGFTWIKYVLLPEVEKKMQN